MAGSCLAFLRNPNANTSKVCSVARRVRSIAKGLAAARAAVAVNFFSDKERADRMVAEINAKGGKAVAI